MTWASKYTDNLTLFNKLSYNFFFISKNCNHLPEIYDNISKTDCENLINNFFKGKR